MMDQTARPTALFFGFLTAAMTCAAAQAADVTRSPSAHAAAERRAELAETHEPRIDARSDRAPRSAAHSAKA
ncbi:MAG: hypothetical protein DI565_00975 [Ancylobacter novellus]|uniref:Uncharacterized protein n=1 Tax=Ancylobacter novellus TaxID=921 RepID=A0A2W5KPK0_ANCNO|nr:MAG: hypothetical protein DI565_00975 [Ancylobacter novellus]